MSRWFLMPDVQEIIERLREQSWRNGFRPHSAVTVLLTDAEDAVVAAVDARTREIVDWLWTDAPLKEAYAREMLADEVARRFPVSDCDTTRNEPPHGEGPAHEPGDRS